MKLSAEAKYCYTLTNIRYMTKARNPSLGNNVREECWT